MTNHTTTNPYPFTDSAGARYRLVVEADGTEQVEFVPSIPAAYTRNSPSILPDVPVTVVHPDHGPVPVLGWTLDRAGILAHYVRPDGSVSNRDTSMWPDAHRAMVAVARGDV